MRRAYVKWTKDQFCWSWYQLDISETISDWHWSSLQCSGTARPSAAHRSEANNGKTLCLCGTTMIRPEGALIQCKGDQPIHAWHERVWSRISCRQVRLSCSGSRCTNQFSHELIVVLQHQQMHGSRGGSACWPHNDTPPPPPCLPNLTATSCGCRWSISWAFYI